MISKKTRVLIYMLCAIALLHIRYSSSEFEAVSITIEIFRPILFLFFAGKIINLLGNIKLENFLEKAAVQTEFLHDGKIYKIDNAEVIKEINYPYHFSIDFARSIFGYSLKESVLKIVLYRTPKENYYIYALYNLGPTFRVAIDPLSVEQTKNWLLENDMTAYKQIFGEIEEA